MQAALLGGGVVEEGRRQRGAQEGQQQRGHKQAAGGRGRRCTGAWSACNQHGRRGWPHPPWKLVSSQAHARLITERQQQEVACQCRAEAGKPSGERRQLQVWAEG